MDKEDLKNMALGDLLDGLPDAVPGLNETPELHKIRVEGSSIKRNEQAKEKARKVIDKMLSFYLSEDIIDKYEYIKAKSEVDKMQLGALIMQMENSEKAINSLMDQIEEGDVAPRIYEVLSELQRTQLDIIKTQTTYLVAVEENTKKAQREIELFEMQTAIDTEASEIDENKEQKGGGAKVRGARDLMIALRNSVDSCKIEKDEEFVHKDAPDYIQYEDSEIVNNDDDEFIDE